MRVLLVTQEFPYPPDNGVRWKTYNLLRCMGGRYQCDVLAFAPVNLPVAAVDQLQALPGVSVLGVFEPEQMSAFSKMKTLIRIGLASAARYESGAFRTALFSAVRSQHYDLVILDMINMTIFAPLVSPCPVIFSVNDAVSLGYWNYAKSEGTLFRRVRWGLGAWVIRRYERKNYPRARAVHVVSDVDRLWLQKLCGSARVTTIGQGVSDEFLIQNDQIPHPPRKTILIPARLADPSSRLAVERFIQKSFQGIAESDSDVELEIIGRGRTNQQMAGSVHASRVHYAGWIADYRAALSASAVVVFPENGGSGAKNRVLQALAVGRPVILTPHAARGVGCQHGAECMVAASDQEFAAATLAVLRDRSVACRLGEAARKFVLNRHGLARIAGKWDALFLEAAGKKPFPMTPESLRV